MGSIIVLIFIIFIVGLVVKYDKFILLTLVLSPWLSLMILWGKTLLYFISIFAFLLYLIKKRKKQDFKSFPFWICIIAITVSRILTELYNSEMKLSIIASIFSQWLIVFLCWNCLKTKKQINFFVNATIFVSAIVVIYGFFEEITQSNIYTQYLRKYQDVYFNYVESRANITRYGFTQITSLFVSRDFCGLYCTMYFLFYGYIQNKFPSFKGKMQNLLMIGLFALVIFTTARSVYLGFFVGCFLFVNHKTLKQKWFLAAIVLSLFFLPTVTSYISEVVSSFTSTSSIGGSDTSMREQQLAFSFYQMMKSPIFGNGLTYTVDITDIYREEIYGSESIWFSTMMTYGLLGVISYLIAFIYPMYYMFKKKLYGCVFILLSYVVIQSMTNCPQYPYLIFPVIFLRLVSIRTLELENIKTNILKRRLEHNNIATLVSKTSLGDSNEGN